MSIVFFELDEVIEIHSDQVERYGGRPGIRDMGLLQSALAMPQAGVGNQYVHSDVFEMAAAYLYYIVRNHPFVDGNKRVGALAAFVFLRLNSVTLNASEPAFERLVVRVAEGRVSKGEVAAFFRNGVRSRA